MQDDNPTLLDTLEPGAAQSPEEIEMAADVVQLERIARTAALAAPAGALERLASHRYGKLVPHQNTRKSIPIVTRIDSTHTATTSQPSQVKPPYSRI